MDQTVEISPQQQAMAAQAGIRFLNLETTLIPGNMRKQLDVLEVILGGLANGQLVLASANPDPVESDLDSGEGPAQRPSAKDIALMASAAGEGAAKDVRP